MFCTAPELLLGGINKVAKAQDVRSFGMLVHEVLPHQNPSTTHDPSERLAALEVNTSFEIKY